MTLALGSAVTLSVTAAHAPGPASRPRVDAAARQGGLAGRYVLRSVNGLPPPATMQGEDNKHSVQVTDGVLTLNPDGSYLCRTVAAAVHLKLKEPFADSLHGTYAVLQSGAIQFSLKGNKADTIVTTGFQISWVHPLRLMTARFLYSK
jgi:hypothetical protein